MSDITKCGDRGCPSRRKCWRYMAPSSGRQSYAEFNRAPEADACEEFWPMEQKTIDNFAESGNYRVKQKRCDTPETKAHQV